ncbi:MAG: PDZ domain-containing protein [Chitinophagaceae bacterium]
MKQYFLKTICIASFALIGLPSFAQKEKEEKDIKVKTKNDIQQIIITRKGNGKDKTVIEIVGDDIKINGKNIGDVKDVTVHLNKLKDINALASVKTLQGKNFDFNMNNGGISLFSEDENRAMLGVVTDEDEKGAKITSVTRESAAEKAGLKSGDIITKIDNKKIVNAEDVSEAVHEHKPGDKIALTILRGGKEQNIKSELGKWKGLSLEAFKPIPPMPPEMWKGMMPPEAPQGFGFKTNGMFEKGPSLGLSVQDTEDGKGVKVLEVDEEGNAAKGGIKVGDVILAINDITVSNTDTISRAFRQNKDKSSVKLLVMRNGKNQTIEVRLPRKLKTADL